MPDRLDELRKQRALVQQHLTWLDHEIAAVTVNRLTLPPFAIRQGTRGPIPVPPGGTVPIPELSDFQVDPADVQVDTRKGCILYAALAFLVLVLIMVAIYFLGYRDNPVLFAPTKSGPTMVYPVAPPKTPPPPAQRPAPTNPPPK
jgi:hypothetical protein